MTRVTVHELIVAALLGMIMGILGYYITRKITPVIGDAVTGAGSALGETV